jgi:hypothetical protein
MATPARPAYQYPADKHFLSTTIFPILAIILVPCLTRPNFVVQDVIHERTRKENAQVGLEGLVNMPLSCVILNANVLTGSSKLVAEFVSAQ